MDTADIVGQENLMKIFEQDKVWNPPKQGVQAPLLEKTGTVPVIEGARLQTVAIVHAEQCGKREPLIQRKDEGGSGRRSDFT